MGPISWDFEFQFLLEQEPDESLNSLLKIIIPFGYKKGRFVMRGVAVIRVRFPDNHTLEATFHPSETIQSLIDLLMKALAQPDLPFYICEHQIKDTSQDFYSVGFAPGAIVYFSYDQPKGGLLDSLSFLKEDVMPIKGMELIPEEVKPEVDQATTIGSVAATSPAPVQEREPSADKKMVDPLSKFVT
ncbi:hypothetical protein R6Q59_022945 [Mikania micrantha]